MLEQAAADMGLDLGVRVIGDRLSDMQAGRSVRATTVLVPSDVDEVKREASPITSRGISARRFGGFSKLPALCYDPGDLEEAVRRSRVCPGRSARKTSVLPRTGGRSCPKSRT
jgi:hypothetical protein